MGGGGGRFNLHVRHRDSEDGEDTYLTDETGDTRDKDRLTRVELFDR